MATRVLIVDDNENNLYLLESILKASDYQVISAQNGQAALKMAQAQPPDLIVSDILMPVMDGYALCRECKSNEQLKNVPFVFYTATYTESKDERFALDLGADRFIIKPQEPEILIKILIDLLNEKKTFKPATEKPLGEEMEFLRQHNEALFKKLEKKMSDLETANQELKDLEEKYRLSINQVSDVIFIIDADLKISSISPSLEKILGYTPEEFIGRPVSELKHILTPDSFEKAFVNISLVLKGEMLQPNLYEFITRDGTRKHIEIHGSPIIRNRQIVGTVSVARDITERRHNEQALRDSEARLLEAQRIAKIGNWEHDLLTNKFVWSDEIFRIFGIDRTRCSASYEAFLSAIHPDDRDAVKAAYARSLENKQLCRITHRLLMPNGRIKYVSERCETYYNPDGKPVRSVGTVQDITERKQTEEAFHQSEQRFRGFVENATDLIFALNKEGILTYLSPNWLGLMGELADEAVGKSFESYVHPDDVDLCWDYFERMFRTGEPDKSYDFRAFHHDGSVVWYSIKASPLRDDKGNIVGSTGIARDITERKKTEEKLKASESRYKMLFTCAAEGILVAEVQTRQFIHANPALCRMFGCTEEEMLRLKVEDIHPEESLKQVLAEFDALSRGEKTHAPNIPCLHKNGSLFYADISTTSMILDGLQCNVGFFTDITKRKEAENELQKLASIVRHSSDLINLATPDGKMFFLNEAGCQMLGIEPDQVNQFSIEDIIPDHLLPVIRTELLPALQKGGTWEGELQYRNLKTGMLTDVYAMTFTIVDPDSNKTLYLANVSRDITERKQAETALRNSEARLIESQSIAKIGNWEHDFQKNTFFWSDEMFRIFELDPEHIKLSYEVFLEAIHPEDREAANALFKQQAFTNLNTYGISHRLLLPDGRIKYINAQGKSYCNPEGKLIRLVGTAQDITDLKQAEEALRESEAFRQRVFESSQIPIVIMNVDTFRYVDCNPAATKIYCFSSREETLGKTPLDVSAPVQYDNTPSPEKAFFYIEKALAEGMAVFEWRHQRPNGEVWDAEVSLMSFQSGNQHFIQFTLRDITEHKRVEEALQKSEENFRRSLDDSPLGARIVSATGKTIYANRVLLDIYGLKDIEELHTTPGKERYTPESYAEHQIRKEKRRRGELQPSEYEVSIIRKGKDIRRLQVFRKEILWNGEQQFQVLYSDITERKRSEDALRVSEGQLRSIFENAEEIIHIIDWDGTFRFISPSWEHFTGFPVSTTVGQSFVPFVHPDDASACLDVVKNVYETGQPHKIMEFRVKHASGKWIWFMNSGTAIKDEQGKPLYFLGVATDITERKRLQDQLLQSQKMESVGRLAGGVAHDFNNMLGVILGHAELAMEKIEPDQPLYTNLREIRKAADRSVNLTRQLLAFARKQTVSPRIIDMNETVAGMLKMLQRLIGEDIHLAWLPGVNPWPVRIDPSQVDQILANLCVNARDAIAGVGKVTIESSNLHFDEAFCMDHPDFSPGDYVLLAVSDDGCGMDKEIRDKLFEPFFTTKEIGKGTGLGLATVYGIVRQNNGFINIYSELGQGTTVRIYLPRHIGKAEQGKSEEPQESVIRGHETLLVVEDELAILDLSKIMLERQGYRVLSAATPGEAIKLAEEYQGEIHLLITDVVMPEMNGRDLAKKILSLYPDMKRLFMSGYTADVIAHQGVLDEGVSFIQKPFSRNHLIDKVREVLDQK